MPALFPIRALHPLLVNFDELIMGLAQLWEGFHSMIKDLIIQPEKF
jgi:hypothetical protein